MIDLYCERLGDGYFAEPLNAISNIAFLVSAFYGWRLIRQQSEAPSHLYSLIFLMAAIGLGSLSFHVFANQISQLADLLPIFVFQLFYLWFYAKSVWHVTAVNRIILCLIFVGSVIFSSRFAHYLNGSMLYLPTLVLILFISLNLALSSKAQARLASTALGLFSASLIFRSIDNFVCAGFSVGTHFMWHLLNGWVIYLMFKLLVQSTSQSDKRRSEAI